MANCRPEKRFRLTRPAVDAISAIILLKTRKGDYGILLLFRLFNIDGANAVFESDPRQGAPIKFSARGKKVSMGAADVKINPETTIDTIVFDLGNVLIPWNPYWLYRKLLPDDKAIAAFFAEVDFGAWILSHDAGEAFADGIARMGEQFPQRHHLFQAYFDRWEETIGEPFAESVALLKRLRRAGYRTFALTNFSKEMFPRARVLQPLLGEFDGVVVSGEERLTKPDPAIYRLLCERFDVQPQRAVFIDDSLPNVEGARRIGMHAIHFTAPERLEAQLADLGVGL